MKRKEPTKPDRFVLEAKDCKPHWKQWQEAKDAFIASSKTKLVRFIAANVPFNNQFRDVQREMQSLFTIASIAMISITHPNWSVFLPLQNKFVEHIFLEMMEPLFALFIVQRFPHPEIDEVALEVMARKQHQKILNRDLALETLRYFNKRKLSKYEVSNLTVKYESKRLVYRHYDPSANIFNFQNRNTVLAVPNVLGYYHTLESIFHTYIPFFTTIMDYLAPHQEVADYLSRPTIVCK